MDSIKHPNPKVHNHLSLSYNSPRIINFFVSVSLFSVSFLLLPFLLQSFKPYFMQLFNYTIGKSYMFLLCNGLLAILAKNSGLIDGSSPSTDQTKEFTIDNAETDHSEFKELEDTAPIGGENDEEIEYPQEEEKNSVIVGQEDGLSDTIEEAAGEEEENAIIIIEEAAGEEEANASIIIDEEDTEELNKKCEDFIRKMKAAFCSEPRADYCSDFYFQTALVTIN